jgi:hypothetical protein
MRGLVRGIGHFLLRWLLFYCICFTFPFPLDLLGLPFGLVEADRQPAWMKAAGDGFTRAYVWVDSKKGEACVWVGEHLLHVEVIIQPTGSGDTMRAYVGCLCAAVIAAGLAVLWSAAMPLVRRWKPAWRADLFLHVLVRLLVRFFLIEMLFGYGFAKVFALQFAEPDSFRLNERLGDMSPMGLMWTFMGFSPAYQIFTGAVEVVAGLLLVSRRTTLLGALVTTAAMTHVFIMNLCFDVPVKLYSFHYLVMALFLIAPDLRWLTMPLVLGKSVETKPIRPLFERVPMHRSALVFRTVLVAAMLYGHIKGNYTMARQFYGDAPPPVVGRWDVVSMSIDKKELKKDDPATWKWIDVSEMGMIRVSKPSPPNLGYRATWTAADKSLKLTKFTAPTWEATLNYDLPQPELLKLDGSIDDKQIAVTLKPSSEKHQDLKTRGFHWVQELPYNR